MKKKIMASLLVGSAVVGASLAPLSAQAVTTGNTPVTVGFDGGALPDVGGDPNTVRPDPGATNSNFDLLFIPREFDFGKLSISDDLTAQSTGLKLGTDSIEGSITSSTIKLVPLRYSVEDNKYIGRDPILADPVAKPEIVNETTFSIPLGGDAVLLANATAGKGQGLWRFSMLDSALNITTPYQQIKAGNYTGNITWNLVAGPSI